MRQLSEKTIVVASHNSGKVREINELIAHLSDLKPNQRQS